MNPVTLCEACGHELRLQTDWFGRIVLCPGCQARLKHPALAVSRTANWGRRLGLSLFLVALVSVPVAFGASKMLWPAEPVPAYIEDGVVPVSKPDRPKLFPIIPAGDSGPMPPAAQARIDPHLVIPATVDAHLVIPTTSPPDGGPRLVGRLPASLAFASDPSRKLLFSSGDDGSLRWFDEATLRPVGSRVLPGVAYHLVCDGPRGKLYAALSSPTKLQFGPLNDRFAALGDIHVFDLERLLGPAVGPALVVKVIPCQAHVWSMRLSPDRASLHYFAETSLGVQVACVDVLDRHEPKVIEMQLGGALALTRSPDGKTLYGLAGGRLFAVDVAEWSVRWSILVGSNIMSLAAGPADQLYLIERRLSLHLLVVDLDTRQVVSRYGLGLEGRPYFCSSADGRRAYFSNSAVTSGLILAFDVSGKGSPKLRLTGWSRGNRDLLVRGGIRLSDDGRFLLTGVGQLYRVGS